MRATSGSISRLRSSRVPSREQSSTMMISLSAKGAAFTVSTTARIVAFSLKQGMTTEIFIVSSIHRLEEFAIALGVAQLVEQEIDAIHCAHRIENPAQHVHLLEHIGRREQFFLAGAGPCDVDGREGAFVRDLAIENKFGIAGALELFEDHFVHAATGIDERGCDDGERTSFLDIARGTEKALRTLQRIGIDTAGEHLAGRWHDRVVGAA